MQERVLTDVVNDNPDLGVFAGTTQPSSTCPSVTGSSAGSIAPILTIPVVTYIPPPALGGTTRIFGESLISGVNPIEEHEKKIANKEQNENLNTRKNYLGNVYDYMAYSHVNNWGATIKTHPSGAI